MALNHLYIGLLMLSLACLCAQILVKQKRAVHLVFAVFCGSIAMVAVKQLGATTLAPYHYLIGIGTCATCNAFWLVSRGLFREKGAIEARHIALAVFIAGLIVMGQMLKMTEALSGAVSNTHIIMTNTVSVVVNFLSSTILCLSLWEALRGYTQYSGAAKHQRTLFIVAYSSVVSLCSFVAPTFLNEQQFAHLFPWFTGASAMLILVVTQIVLLWQTMHKQADQSADLNDLNDLNEREAQKSKTAQQQECPELLKGITHLIEKNQGFLQADLKIQDLAQALNVPEYRISRAIRWHFPADSFKQYINQLRVSHAQALLLDANKAHWTILVIALESGFSSLVSFNRVFKSICDCTPTQYRRKEVSNSLVVN